MNTLAGREGGQKYDLPKAIRNILGQMGQNTPIGTALIKELMQNADDAQADELHLYLDERTPPKDVERQLREKDLGCLAEALLGPALIVRNNRPFRKPGDPGAEEKDDFKALCEVAWGHKVNEVTSAGRFGIGFNSAYLVTETPMIYSRREIHVFDPRQIAFTRGGWIFTLEDLQGNNSGLGVEKPLLFWCFPRIVMGRGAPPLERATQDDLDCREAAFRFPLRTSEEPAPSLSGGGPDRLLWEGVFSDHQHRRELARFMFDAAAKAIIFMKHLRLVSLWEVRDGMREPRLLARVQMSLRDPRVMTSFLEQVDRIARTWQETSELASRVETELFRLQVETTIEPEAKLQGCRDARRTYWVQHRACFDSEPLHTLARKLHKNGERCVPWVAAAFPADADSFLKEDGKFPPWRVFLPLTEEGPSQALLHAACFVDPSRRGVEFADEISGSDASTRKTDWNKALIEHGLTPLLTELSLDLAEKLKPLIQSEPARYLSLIPSRSSHAQTLAAHLCRCFHEDEALVTVFDLWGEPLELFLGSEQGLPLLEQVPEWLVPYSEEFRPISSDQRRYVPYKLGQALSQVLDGVIKRGPLPETASQVLRADKAPKERDLVPLLRALESRNEVTLDGCWGIVDLHDGSVLQYLRCRLYLLITNGKALPAPLQAVLDSRKKLVDVSFVRSGAGLGDANLRAGLRNLVDVDDAIFQALERVENASAHDSCPDLGKLQPLVDFLVLKTRARVPEALCLGWLVRTAHGVASRRAARVLLIPPESPKGEGQVLWDGFLREAFAQVDPQLCQTSLRRLLNAGFGDLLTSEEGVRVESPKPGSLLPLLFQASEDDPTVLDRMEAAFNRPVSRGGALRPEALRASSLLLGEADTRWEELSDAQKQRFLALPVHRSSEGNRFLRLQSEPREGWEKAIRKRFRLQGDGDDLRDAPIHLSKEVALLHSDDKAAYKFYRSRLGLDPHGRTAVLKDCLEQVGSGEPQDWKLFAYLCLYLKQRILELSASSDPLDLRLRDELNELQGRARIVPTSRGEWCTLDEAVDPTDVRKRLEKHGYRGKSLDELVASLFHPRKVVDAAHLDQVGELPQRPHRASFEEAALGALSSEDPALHLRDRVHVVLAFDAELQESARATKQVMTTALIAVGRGGRLPLAEARLPRPGPLTRTLQSRLLPEIVDMEALSSEWSIAAGELEKALAQLGLECVSEDRLETALSEDLPKIWGESDEKDCRSLLQFLAQDVRRSTRFADVCADLPTVLCSGGDWRAPSEALPPCWLSARPPEALWPALADPGKVDPRVRAMWDLWSPWRDPANLVERVLTAFIGLEEKKRRDTLPALSTWLKAFCDGYPGHGLLEAVRTTAWVPARTGSERRLGRPDAVVVHDARDVLSERFLVADVPPSHLPLSLRELGFRRHLEPNPENLDLLADCLEECRTSVPGPWRAAYEEAAHLLEQEPSLRVRWRERANQSDVFRLFRSPDRRVRLNQVFLGSGEAEEDFGDLLFCLDNGGKVPEWVPAVYADLGVSKRPAWMHLSQALANLDGRPSGERKVHAKLVRTMRELEELRGAGGAEAAAVCLLACDGTYRPLRELVSDEELGYPDALAPSSRRLVLDSRCRESQQLLKFLSHGGLALIEELRSSASARLASESVPGPDDPESAQRVLPWRDWIELLRDEGSIVHAELDQVKGIHWPPALGQVVNASRIHVRYTLPGGQIVETNATSPGPLALMDQDGTLYLRPADPAWTESDARGSGPDERIKKEILRALSAPQTDRTCLVQRLDDQVRLFLERPSYTLKILADANRRSIRDLYRDQNADQDFEELWTQYTRTARKDERARLEAQMQGIVEGAFVARRAEQIRGHGYDEHSVFAELVQNAEDAYLDSEKLGLEVPSPAWVRFRMLDTETGPTLQVEHAGRPFNYWRHGGRSERLFRHDVEGLLRSAGSFKPQTERDSGPRRIGRFGLGFKSVYLLTDEPTVHSHHYHFEIECGCIPQEVTPPTDLEPMTTRLMLPLRGGQMPDDFTASARARFLMVFLRAVGQIDFVTAAGQALSLSSRVLHGVEVGADLVAQRLELAWKEPEAKSGVLRFVRVRSASGADPAQVALMLDASGMPIPWPWQETSEVDFFAALPLQARLGCGLAVSHFFAVESGRTHLRQDEENELRFEEAARLARPLVGNLVKVCQFGVSSQHSASSLLERFWGIWRWDRGDAALDPLRRKLAEQLLQAAEDLPVAPTLQEDAVVAIGSDTELFSTLALPLEFVTELTSVLLEVPLTGGGTASLLPSRTLSHPFLRSLERLARRAGREPRGNLVEIGWNELGQAFHAGSWLADHPYLVGIMGRVLEGKERESMLVWLRKCRVAGKAKEGPTSGVPGRFMSYRADDLTLLPPERVLVLSEAYDRDALKLLMEAGTQSSVPSEEIIRWLREGLNKEEAVNLITYFLRSGRWRTIYYDRLRQSVQSAWIQVKDKRITPRQARGGNLLPNELLRDSSFVDWLGARDAVREVVAPDLDPQETLQKIYSWWKKESPRLLRDHVQRTYPQSRQPDFGSFQEPGGRQEWFTLFLLGALHTMGRTRPQQHRSFLELCQRKGWMDIFCRPDATADEWIGVLDSYIETGRESATFSHWMRQFIAIYQLARHLPEYMEQVLESERILRKFSLQEIFKAKSSRIFDGSGISTPSLTSVLGYGQNFVLRELIRTRALGNQHCYEHCWVPYKRVDDLLGYIRSFDPKRELSTESHFEYLMRTFEGDEQKATFHLTFDIPFQFIAEDGDLLRRFLGDVTFAEEDW